MYRSAHPETSFDAGAFVDEIRQLVSHKKITTRGQSPAEVAKEAARFHDEAYQRFSVELDNWIEAGLLSTEWPDGEDISFDRETFIESFSNTVRMLAKVTDRADRKGLGPGTLSALSDEERNEIYTIFFAQYAELLAYTAEEDHTVYNYQMESNAVLYHTADIFEEAREKFGDLPQSVYEMYIFANPGKTIKGLETLTTNVAEIRKACPEITPAYAVWIALKNREDPVGVARDRLATAKELSVEYPELKPYMVFEVVMRRPKNPRELIKGIAQGFRELTDAYPEISESDRAYVARRHGEQAVKAMANMLVCADELADSHPIIPESLRWHIVLFNEGNAVDKANKVVKTAAILQSKYPEVPPSWFMLMAVNDRHVLRRIDAVMDQANQITERFPQIPTMYRLRLAVNHKESCLKAAELSVTAEQIMQKKYPSLLEWQRWHIAVYYEKPLDTVKEIMADARKLQRKRPGKAISTCLNRAIQQRSGTKEILLEAA